MLYCQTVSGESKMGTGSGPHFDSKVEKNLGGPVPVPFFDGFRVDRPKKGTGTEPALL